MTDNFGTGVSRVLDPQQTGYLNIIFQEGKPPLDSEFALVSQLSDENTRQLALRGTPSGWYGDVINPQDSFVTNVNWSNWFRFGPQLVNEKQAIMWANVNGWTVPVTGTLTGFPPGQANDSDTWNRITLPPPPANTGDARIDFVFLEVWKAKIAPNPSTTNKPAAAAIYRFGNVEGGYTFITDDLQDPEIGFETSQRVQLQYRIRVVSGLVGLASYPDGFDPSVVKGQGAAATPTSYIFENMRSELGDPGLWRSGDGTQNALGTVDGYSYAIPIAAVFRRNSVAWDVSNLNGGISRNPTAVDRTGYKTFSSPTALASSITAAATSLVVTSAAGLVIAPATPFLIQIGSEYLTYTSITGTTLNGLVRGVNGSLAASHQAGSTVNLPVTLATNITSTSTSLVLSSVANIPLPLGPASPLLIQIGDEILTYTAITGTTMSGLSRAQNGSIAEAHVAGSIVKLLAIRPDGLYTDQVISDDILDLRHVVNPGGFDYQALLQTNLDKLLRGKLNSTWKRGGNSSQGPRVNYVDYISASAGPLGTDQLDAPDGIRSLWSDPSALQPVVIPVKYPPTGTNPSLSIGGTLGNSFGSVVINHAGGAGFQIGDIITIPKSLFTASLPGTDVDQVQLIADSVHVQMRFFGETLDLATIQYSLSNAVNGDLLITFTGSFVPRAVGAIITMHVQYGPGRGLSRRPDAIHDVLYLASGPNIATQLQGIPVGDRHMRTSWLALWGQYQNSVVNSCLPSTAECHIDPGSKSIALTPYRLLTFTVTDTNSQLRTVQKSTTALTGAMPSLNLSGGAKWATTDPLNLFSSYSDPVSGRASMTVILPRKIIPGFGEIRAPILYQDYGNFAQGINFLVNAPKGTTLGATVTTYVPMVNAGGVSYAVFSTLDLNTSTPATYNTAFTYGTNIAGMRFFTDSQGLNRRGLQLPPFYGVARLWAVYSAQDYITYGSSFNPSTRVPDVSGAPNLLRQNFDGSVLWSESDVDGDPSFVLNADAIDVGKSISPISSFAAGDYVIECSIVGLDRGFLDLSQDPRLVLTRDRIEGLTNGSTVTHPSLILPSAPEVGDQIAIAYSRYGYQGDCWNSQLLASDIGIKYGTMTTASRYQLMTTSLAYDSLSRPNQKSLEVLASIGFITTLGTGRFSGNVGSSAVDVRNIGYEAWVIPTTSVDPRPALNTGALVTAEKAIPLGSEFVGVTCNLPLGALFRDKDFRGNAVGGVTGDNRQLVLGNYALGIQSGSTANSSAEFAYLSVSASIGTNSGVIVHVDGNGSSYSVLTNYRTNRGGSVFTASGFVGGDFGAVLPSSLAASTSGGIMSGVALLVRNLPTNVGAQEVSAGQEILMLIVTTARPQGAAGTLNAVQCSTSGSGESYSAADLYRLSGHPLTTDAARSMVDPASILLARKSDLL